MKTTFINPFYLLLTALLFGVTACGLFNNEDNLEEDIDNCSDPAFANFDEEPFEITLPEGIKWDGTGNETNFDYDLGIIYLAAPSEGPDDEAIGTLTLLFDMPGPSYLKPCLSIINSATLSTGDVRRGTGEEINGKLYTLVDSSGPSTEDDFCMVVPDNVNSVVPLSSISFSYVSSNRARGSFCIEMQQISPESGEPIKLHGTFAIRNR